MAEAKDTIIEEILQARFTDEDHKTNPQGQTYVEDEKVMDRLDFALGFGRWGTSTQVVSDREVIVTLRLQDPRRNDGQWVEYSDYGSCNTPGSAEMLKEAWTDGFRRVARQAGVARYIYAGELGPISQGQANTPQVGGVAPAPTAPVAQQQQPASVTPPGFGDFCPVHGWPWKVQPGGVSRSTNKPYPPFYKCGGKKGTAYCDERPTDEWVAAHPLS